MSYLDFLPHLISLLSLIASIAAYVSARRGIDSLAEADALRKVGNHVADMEAEILKLQLSLNRAFGERIGLKEEILMLRRDLKDNGIELEELRNGKAKSHAHAD